MNKKKELFQYGNFAFLRLLVFSIIFLLNACAQHQKEPVLQYINAKANVWNVEIWDDYRLVTIDYQGNISMKNVQTGENMWNYPAGAFVFDLKIADLNLDGQPETAFVTAQGELIVLDQSGNMKWSFHSKLPLYNVGIGNFNGDKKLEVACGGIDRHVYVFDYYGQLIGKSPKVERLVHRIAVGNLYGDNHDEILVIENRTIANLMGFENDTLKSFWRKQLKVSDEMINWENPRGNFFPFSIEIDDLNADGINEILMGDTYFNKQAVAVANSEAEIQWISKGIPNFREIDNAPTEFYSTAFVRSGDVFKDIPGKEVVSIAGGYLRIWDKDGALLGSSNSKVGFTDFELTNNQILLGSCPNGDEYIYKVNIEDDWENVFTKIEFKGLIKEIQDNSKQLKNLVEAFEPTDIPLKQYNLSIGFGSAYGTNGLERRQKALDWFHNKFPYENLQIISGLKVIENTPPVDEDGNPWNKGRWKVDAINGTMTVEDILEKARWIEENKIPTLFYIGHSCMPFITLETAEKILQTAPNYCIGFLTAEDESINLIPRYFKHFFEPLANLCLKYGNKLCISKNKGLWWMSSPAHQEVYEAMFKGGRQQVSMAATEDSNSRTPEINLMARGGLWQAGLIAHNDVSIHGDLFSFNRFQEWEYPRVGNQYLRLLVAHTTMGMTQISTRIREIVPGKEGFYFNQIGKESTEIFYHMLGKGIVFSPDREDILGYSPIGIVVHKPEKKWLEDAYNGHRPELWENDDELHNALFPHNGNLWGMTKTPDHAFQKIIFNKERQFGYQIPATPYGLVAFVPEFANLDSVANIHDWWHTDGIYVWKKGGLKYTGTEAAKALKADFEKAAEQLPFKQVDEAVFMQIVRMTENHFRLFLVDPGWVDPKERDVVVKIQMKGIFKAENILEKESYPVSDQMFRIHVPAGLFAIVDVRKES